MKIVGVAPRWGYSGHVLAADLTDMRDRWNEIPVRREQESDIKAILIGISEHRHGHIDIGVLLLGSFVANTAPWTTSWAHLELPENRFYVGMSTKRLQIDSLLVQLLGLMGHLRSEVPYFIKHLILTKPCFDQGSIIEPQVP